MNSMRPNVRPPTPPLDPPTLDHVVRLLTERLDAVVTYGAGGCRACHDAELRGAIAIVRGLKSGPKEPGGIGGDGAKSR